MKLRQEQVDKLREGKATLVADHSKPELMEDIFGDFYIMEDSWDYYYLCINDTILSQKWDACNENVIHKYKMGELIPLADFFEEEEKKIKTYIEPELIKAGDERVLLGMLRTPPKLDVRVVEEENYKLLIKPPKTAEERDEIVKELLASEFKKKLPSELDKARINMLSGHLHISQATLIVLLEMRDTYRDGWIPKTFETEYSYFSEISESRHSTRTKIYFQDLETAKLFNNNFKEDLETVKHLIS